MRLGFGFTGWGWCSGFRVGVGVGAGAEVKRRAGGAASVCGACCSVRSPKEAEMGSLQACITFSCTMRKRLSGSEHVSLIMHAWIGVRLGMGLGPGTVLRARAGAGERGQSRTS